MSVNTNSEVKLERCPENNNLSQVSYDSTPSPSLLVSKMA